MASTESVNSALITSLAKDLIRIPSVTGNLEQTYRVLDRVKEELQGYPCEEFVEPKTGVRSLLFSNTETRPEEFRVILLGHLDVVPGKLEQFNPQENEGKLEGRGASDMKGGAATDILIFKELASQLPYPIGLLLVTDEEVGGFNGTNYVVQQGVRSKLVLAGESTDLNINNEFKGVLVFEATAKGITAHAAYPHEGKNAATLMAHFIADLDTAFPVPPEEEWVTTMNVGGIYTDNTAHNKVPDKSTAVLDIRHTPQDTKDMLRRRIREIAPEGVELEELKDQNGTDTYTDPNNPDLVLLNSTIASVIGQPAKFVRRSGSSDIRHFAAVGSAAADFGPKGVGLHTDNEYGDIQSYGIYAEILTQFLRSLQ